MPEGTPGRGPLIIGLTGMIASGKSTVAARLVERGAAHADADRLAHSLYDPGTPGFDRVVAEFGRDVVGASGYVDRKALGAKVFNDREARLRLARAMGGIGSLLKATIDGWRATLGPEGFAVVDVPALMEPGYGNWCDQVWLVAVDYAVAHERLMATRGLTAEEAAARIGAQSHWDEKEEGADRVYRNNGSHAELEAAIDAELDRILALHRRGALPEPVYRAWSPQYVARFEAARKRRLERLR